MEKNYRLISNVAMTIGITALIILMIVVNVVEELHIYYLLGSASIVFVCGETARYSDKKYRSLRKERIDHE